MSEPDTGLKHARPTPSLSSSSGRYEKLRRPQTRTLQDVVDADDQSRVLECSQAERQLRVQHVIRHYLSQILYGCRGAYCDTPTCLSAQKRNPSRPVRPPTQLTARALAHYLASQDNPHRGLCPHELKIAPSSLEIDDGPGTRLRSERKPLRTQQHTVNAVKQQQQKRKDTKSLAQNLFDSATLIYASSKQLPSSTSVFDTLRSAGALEADAASPGGGSQTGAQDSSSHATVASHANDTENTFHVKGQPRLDRQYSHPNLRARSHGQTLPSSREVLGNGQQVHRIPYHMRDLGSPVKGNKPTSQAALDGTFDSSRLSIAKTGKKSFTLGSIGPDMGRTTPQSKASDKSMEALKARLQPTASIPVAAKLNCNTLEQLKENVYEHRKYRVPDDLTFAIDYDTNGRFRPSKPFVNRSLFYTFSEPEALLKSFHDSNRSFDKSPLPHLDSAHLVNSFRDWNRHNGALIFDSLWVALEALYAPPPELHARRSPRLKPSRKGSRTSPTEHIKNDDANETTPQRYLSNLEAAHVVMICIHALTSLVSVGWPHTWAQLRKLRSFGIVMPAAPPDVDGFADPYLSIVDELEYEPAIRLADRLLGAIGARTCFEHILGTLRKQDASSGVSDDDSLVNIVVQHLQVVERVALASKRRMTPTRSASDDPGWTVTATLMEWLKTIVTKKWDCKVQINKWSSVGTAVMMMSSLYEHFPTLNLRASMFDVPFLNERLDTVEEPLKFLAWEEQPNILHILDHPMLFPTEHIVRYFRTINFTSMMAQYDQTTRTHHMQRSLEMFLNEPHIWLIKSRMKITLSEYLILNVSREDTLMDTLDQLWGLEKRMLLKPLKVKMGQHEGEFGADHGGVSYEFFRVVLSEAFKPDHGMFTLDPQTRMTWFQPNTLEPDWKFEMIGNLFSLAVYNGITLPITFPLALYHFLLPARAPLRDLHMGANGIDFIRDGWPELAKGFEQLLAWTDGDVADVFMRDYAFSYQAFGQRIDHNMEESYVRPSQATQQSEAVRPEDLLKSTTQEAKPVTNANRQEFVRDYIHHLTYLSISPQLHAFRKGFMACLAPRSLHFFSPRTLRNLIEGEQHISISGLRRCTRYEEGYSATHATIESFWRIAEQYTQDDRHHLLEFVTASDRVPVTGYEGITFHIVRVGDAGLLPTSSTCFGKLYLPEYADEETLKAKLELAIRNSKGFGVV